MNRAKMMVLAGILAVAGVGSQASTAQAQAVRGATPIPARRVSVVSSLNGYSNQAITPPSASMYRPGRTRIVPGSLSSSSRANAAPHLFHDWSTGRDTPLAKPWLQPLQ
jgi:hypothetical protein